MPAQLRLLYGDQASAELSDCKRYRYSLRRQWATAAPGTVIVWVMLNPSTADADSDDPTIKKCVGFAKHWDQSAIHVVNLFAFRATDPNLLASYADPIGPQNDRYIDEALAAAARGSHTVIAAWGAHQHPRVAERVQHLRWSAHKHGVQLLCLGKSQSGAPLHPLYLPYSSVLELWP